MVSNEVRAFEAQYNTLVADPESDLTEWDLLRDCEHEEPLEALLSIGLLRRLLNEWAEIYVTKAIVEGKSWSQIGSCLGISKQAAWLKYRDPQDPPPDDE